MTSALSPASPFVGASLRDDDAPLRIVLDRLNAGVLTYRDANKGIPAHLQRRRPVREDR